MPLLKISDKRSNLRLKFKHPFVLNREKKYELGVSKLLFSLDTCVYAFLRLEIVICSKELPQPVTLTATTVSRPTFNNTRTIFLKGINNAYNKIIQDHESAGKRDIANKLKKSVFIEDPF